MLGRHRGFDADHHKLFERSVSSNDRGGLLTGCRMTKLSISRESDLHNLEALQVKLSQGARANIERLAPVHLIRSRALNRVLAAQSLVHLHFFLTFHFSSSYSSSGIVKKPCPRLLSPSSPPPLLHQEQ